MNNVQKVNGVIEAILHYQHKQKEETQTHVEETKMLLDAAAFFDETDGLMNKEAFVNYVTGQTKSELTGLNQFLVDVSTSTKLNIPFLTRTDKSGKRYYWITQSSKTISRGYKLVWTAEIEKLISAYQFQLYRFDLTLDALFQVAIEQVTETV